MEIEILKQTMNQIRDILLELKPKIENIQERIKELE